MGLIWIWGNDFFYFSRSGKKIKGDREFRHSTRDIAKFGRKWGTECLYTRFPLYTLLYAGYSFHTLHVVYVNLDKIQALKVKLTLNIFYIT